MSEQIKYSKVAQILHWLVAGLIVAQYVLAELAEYAASNNEVVQRLALLANHKSIGMTVLALALIRVIWRIFHKPPVLPDSMSVIQKRASHAAHWAIYVLIFALPLSGWLMSSANAYAVSWFNLFVFPDLVSANKSLAGFFHSTHEVLGNVLLVLVIVHVLAALKHHFVDKDGILQRMANALGWTIFVFTLVIVVGAFGRLLNPSSNTADIERPNRTAVVEAPEVKPISDLPVWVIDYQQSFIQFTADQAGAPFDGLWTDWQAEMQFDASRLDGSAFNVTINTAGVSSKDEERDGYIIGSDFFDAENFETATFTTGDFVEKSDGEYTSLSQLSIKGLTKPLMFTFTVSTDDSGQVELNGSASIDRFAWNVGIGDWSDPTWVGQEVTVKVRVVATVAK